MNIQKLPLAERIRRQENGQSAYPEYIPGIIQNLSEMPVMEYLAGLDPKQQWRFFALIDCSGAMNYTYQWAAKKVQELYATSPEQAAEAMRLLAAPMIRYDNYIKKQEAMPHA